MEDFRVSWEVMEPHAASTTTIEGPKRVQTIGWTLCGTKVYTGKEQHFGIHNKLNHTKRERKEVNLKLHTKLQVREEIGTLRCTYLRIRNENCPIFINTAELHPILSGFPQRVPMLPVQTSGSF